MARVFCDEHRIIIWKCLFCVVVPVVFVNEPKLAIIEFAKMVWRAKVKPPAMIVFVCWDFPLWRRWHWGRLRPRFLFGKAMFGWRRWRQQLSCIGFRSSRFAASAMLACPFVESQRPCWDAWFLSLLESHVTKIIESNDIHPDHQMHSPSLTKLETLFRDN